MVIMRYQQNLLFALPWNGGAVKSKSRLVCIEPDVHFIIVDSERGAPVSLS